MSTGFALLFMLATTVAASGIAAYYFSRYISVNRQLFKSDAVATDRANKIQHLQIKIEMMKGRTR